MGTVWGAPKRPLGPFQDPKKRSLKWSQKCPVELFGAHMALGPGPGQDPMGHVWDMGPMGQSPDMCPMRQVRVRDMGPVGRAPGHGPMGRVPKSVRWAWDMGPMGPSYPGTFANKNKNEDVIDD